MIKTLEDYVKTIKDFSTLSSAELIDYFAYYLLVFKNQESIKAKEIELCFSELSIPAYSNIPSYLSVKSKKIKGSQKYIKNKDKTYCISRNSSDEISKNIILDIPKVEMSNALRDIAQRLTNKSEKVFLEEAIKTFEIEAYRASIIMVWLLTIDHLYEYILANKLSEFVIALKKVNKNKSISTKDDFADLKESQLIEVCRSAGIISNDVKKILDTKLGIRNSFAHPSTIILRKSKALEFIEDLIENVVLKY